VAAHGREHAGRPAGDADGAVPDWSLVFRQLLPTFRQVSLDDDVASCSLCEITKVQVMRMSLEE